LVFWSRDPDGTQHNQGDSLNQTTPGINGPTSLAAIKNADNDLAKIRDGLSALGLLDTTDIFVTSDHGFATISKESKTSPSARAYYADVPDGFLPPGFVALDLANALRLPLFDPSNSNAAVSENNHPKSGNGLIGRDPATDFRARYIDDVPVSNADVGKTLARILGVRIPEKGQLSGRVLTEAMQSGREPRFVRKTKTSEPSANGLGTALRYQTVGSTRYFDAAGSADKTVGL
jgi:arylsulfatase A-like enzyme